MAAEKIDGPWVKMASPRSCSPQTCALSLYGDGEDFDVVGTPAAKPSSQLHAIFFVLGAASEVVWCGMLLSIGVFTEQYGTTTMSTMASVQNNFWLWTMVFFTVTPRPPSFNAAWTLVAISFVLMLMVTAVFAWGITGDALPHQMFVMATAANGVCTGAVQILSASLSGMFSVVDSTVPSGLLLGVTAGPLALSIVATILGHCGLSTASVSVCTLLCSLLLLLAAMVAMVRLRFHDEPVARQRAPQTAGSCYSDGGRNKEYLFTRLREMFGNASLVLLSLAFGNFLFCSVPYGARHICAGDLQCLANFQQNMVATSAFAGFVGRALATSVASADKSIKRLSLESALRIAVTVAATWAYATGQFPAGMAGKACAITTLAVVTVWGNMLLIGLSKEAQHACGHSVLFPCPITAQITWVAVQVGCLVGSMMSYMWA